MNETLPIELARRWGHLQYIRQRGPNEWSSECPKCSDSGHVGREWPDRFRMFHGEKPRAWCRRCGYQDFADSDKKDFHITPEIHQQWLQERMVREEQEKRSAEHAIELLRKETQWLRWHEQMPDVGRAFWESKGVPDWAVKYFQLGWCPNKSIWYHSTEYHTPTATIPVFGVGWNLMNVKHRLVNPPCPSDKYRNDRAGIPAALYLTDPDNKPSGECVLVEGEIKAIVLRSRIDKADLFIIGTPGKNIKQNLLPVLDQCSKIYVILDPDAEQQAQELVRTLGMKRARIVTMPCKADDAFTMYGMTEPQFLAALKCGRMVM